MYGTGNSRRRLPCTYVCQLPLRCRDLEVIQPSCEVTCGRRSHTGVIKYAPQALRDSHTSAEERALDTKVCPPPTTPNGFIVRSSYL